ncbi:hypothetical protein FKP32DRAFT_1532299, partial [Trametes sanguinea]
MHSSETGHRLGKVPLVIGMPVIIGQNFDVHAGVVNGTIGTLKSVRYRFDPVTKRRYLLSCVVSVDSDGSDNRALSHLQPGEYPVIQDSV